MFDRTLVMGAVLGVLATATAAQPVNEITSGNSADFFILKQPQRDHRITVTVRPEPGAPTPADFVWERIDPGGNAYRDLLSIRWSATATCASGLKQLRISGPGGSQAQSFAASRKAISGRTLYQSFETDAVDAVCIGWAEAVTARCGENPQTEPSCEQERTFRFDAEQPLPGSAPVQISGSCQQGNLAPNSYRPRLQVTCRFEQP